jgi:predicted O-linked N-acetylglucosamine transferase (SPINDLY family)
MNTDLEAFSFGLPVVTLPTNLQRGRHTLGMYRKMGFTSCVANDPGDYVDIAVRIATDSVARDEAREQILRRSRQLFEDPVVVRGFEQFFETAVERIRSAQSAHQHSL